MDKQPIPPPLLSRKRFFSTALQSASALGLIPITLPGFSGAAGAALHTLTVQQIIDRILAEGKLEVQPSTVDTIKCGTADQAVTGIVTTMFPTIGVIEAAIKLQANFIIAHEPSFYNHEDRKDYVPKNETLSKKLALLNEHKMVIWRFHDYCHSLKPDAVLYGFAKRMNWLNYFKTGSPILDIPPITLGELVHSMRNTFKLDMVRVIGDEPQTCKKIALLPGAWGGQHQITTAEDSSPDVMIVGEVHEWETAEYIRDARALGKKISLVVLGHSVSEEPGMEWVATWLQTFVKGVPISHVPSGSPFRLL